MNITLRSLLPSFIPSTGRRLFNMSKRSLRRFVKQIVGEQSERSGTLWE